MSRFEIIINWTEGNEIKNTVINCINIPKRSTIFELKEVFNFFLDNINNNFNTSKKCMDYMYNFTKGPFIYKHIDRPYKLNYIDLSINMSNTNIFNRENENFIFEFNKSFEIIRNDNNQYSWRFINDTEV